MILYTFDSFNNVGKLILLSWLYGISLLLCTLSTCGCVNIIIVVTQCNCYTKSIHSQSRVHVLHWHIHEAAYCIVSVHIQNVDWASDGYLVSFMHYNIIIIKDAHALCHDVHVLWSTQSLRTLSPIPISCTLYTQWYVYVTPCSMGVKLSVAHQWLVVVWQ